MMKKSIFLIFIFSVNIFMAVSQPTVKESYRFLIETITFFDDGTFVETRTGADILPLKNMGDDTISYGKYLFDKNNYYLYTSPDWRSSVIKLGKVQELDHVDPSTLHIQLLSPFENMRSQRKGFKHFFFYMFTIHYKDNKGDSHDTICGPYFENQIDIGMGVGFEVKRMDIKIYPFNTDLVTPEIPYLRSVYLPVNPKTTLYVIELPQFKAMYPFWRRYYGYVIPKVSRNAIFKDGEYWIRTGVYGMPKKLKKRSLNSPYSEDNEY